MTRTRPDIEREVAKWRTVTRPRPTRIEPTGPGRESVWDFPRPPRLETVDKRVRVDFAGRTIADSTRACRIVETAGAPCYYLPPHDVETDALRATDATSICEWKGAATYWDLVSGDRVSERAAWTYPEPLTDLGQDYERIAGWYAFYPARADGCWLDDEQVRPQPGGFYGGWVTDALTGPIKGVPGSDGW